MSSALTPSWNPCSYCCCWAALAGVKPSRPVVWASATPVPPASVSVPVASRAKRARASDALMRVPPVSEPSSPATGPLRSRFPHRGRAPLRGLGPYYAPASVGRLTADSGPHHWFRLRARTTLHRSPLREPPSGATYGSVGGL